MKCQYLFFSVFFLTTLSAATPLSKCLTEYNIPGGSCVLYENGRVSYTSEGTVSAQSVVPTGEHTLFRIGTLTTLFTAHVFAELAHQGRIRLDDPVAKFLSSRQLVPQFGKRNLTLKDVATHTTGFPEEPFAAHQPAFLQSRSLYAFLSSHTLTEPPGSTVSFSHAGIALLSVILNKVTKESLATLVDTVVCKKLGMEDTLYSLRRSIPNTISCGHVRQELLLPKDQENRGSAFYDALGLYSSVHDLGKFLSFFLDTSRAEDPLRTLLLKGADHPIGICAIDPSCDMFVLSSATLGYGSYFAFSLSKKRGIAVLLNKEDVPIDEIGRRLFRELE